MKWLVAVTLVAASLSVLVPALLRQSEDARSSSRLDQIHETASV